MNRTVAHILFICVGVISTDNEDETQRPEEASDGEVQRGGGTGLRRGGQVIHRLFTFLSTHFCRSISLTVLPDTC